MTPQESGARLRTPVAPRLPAARHIRSISEEVIDQWVVTSP
jgi:hypothetical protein